MSLRLPFLERTFVERLWNVCLHVLLPPFPSQIVNPPKPNPNSSSSSDTLLPLRYHRILFLVFFFITNPQSIPAVTPNPNNEEISLLLHYFLCFLPRFLRWCSVGRRSHPWWGLVYSEAYGRRVLGRGVSRVGQ